MSNDDTFGEKFARRPLSESLMAKLRGTPYVTTEQMEQLVFKIEQALHDEWQPEDDIERRIGRYVDTVRVWLDEFHIPHE